MPGAVLPNNPLKCSLNPQYISANLARSRNSYASTHKPTILEMKQNNGENTGSNEEYSGTKRTKLSSSLQVLSHRFLSLLSCIGVDLRALNAAVDASTPLLLRCNVGAGRGAVAVHMVDSAITKEEDVVRRLRDAQSPKAKVRSGNVVRKPWRRCLGNDAAAAGR